MPRWLMVSHVNQMIELVVILFKDLKANKGRRVIEKKGAIRFMLYTIKPFKLKGLVVIKKSNKLF